MWFYLHVGYKIESNEWKGKANKQNPIDTDNGVVLEGGK